MSFNATTAFLLPLCIRDTNLVRLAVSMPPRRSCFYATGWRAASSRKCFNATTAFLLRGLGPFRGAGPSLFQCHHGVPASRLPGALSDPKQGFNATTAFLLRFRVVGLSEGFLGFNATTAFLLLGRSWFRLRKISRFQCHHGVPASHGGTAEPNLTHRVSMPPRRSCFLCRYLCTMHMH